MRHLGIAALILGTLITAGCDEPQSIVSLHPLYDDRTLVFEPGLIGSWKADDPALDEKWIFQQSDERTYRLLLREGSGTTEFDAGLTQIAGFLYLDLSARGGNLTGIPGHVVARLQIGSGDLHLTELNGPWMRQRLAQGAELSHFETRERLVVTASTTEL